jgi:glycosyltransferase involved in cell wall biosynthesis
VLPSLWEGYGITLLEAMAFGLPIVATRVGGVPEIITDGINGLLVAPGDVRDLARTIEYLIEHPDYSDRLAKSGVRTAILARGWTNVGEEVKEIMEEAGAKR